VVLNTITLIWSFIILSSRPNKNVDIYYLVCTTPFWNNLHQVHCNQKIGKQNSTDCTCSCICKSNYLMITTTTPPGCEGRKTDHSISYINNTFIIHSMLNKQTTSILELWMEQFTRNILFLHCNNLWIIFLPSQPGGVVVVIIR
jgi:hypothetical protein